MSRPPEHLFDFDAVAPDIRALLDEAAPRAGGAAHRAIGADRRKAAIWWGLLQALQSKAAAQGDQHRTLPQLPEKLRFEIRELLWNLPEGMFTRYL